MEVIIDLGVEKCMSIYLVGRVMLGRRKSKGVVREPQRYRVCMQMGIT